MLWSIIAFVLAHPTCAGNMYASLGGLRAVRANNFQIPLLLMLQTFQNAEKLGLYGKNTVGTTDYYIAAGDSGLITTGGTIGGIIIAGA